MLLKLLVHWRYFGSNLIGNSCAKCIPSVEWSSAVIADHVAVSSRSPYKVFMATTSISHVCEQTRQSVGRSVERLEDEVQHKCTSMAVEQRI